MGPRILVVGPGALGVLVAVRLACRQHNVTAAVRDRDAAAALPRVWQVDGLDGRPLTAEVPTVHAPRSAGIYDLLVLATKCQDAEEALERWLPALASDGAVVAIQNGLLGDRLAALAADRLVEATVALPASLLAPGHSQQTGPGNILLGPWPDARMEPATPWRAAASVLSEVAPTRVHRNMRGVKWTKLLINSAISGLGAVAGQPLGPLLDDARARTAFLHIVTEGHRAGAADGVRFETVAGFHPRVALLGRNPLAAARGHAFLRIVGRKYRRQESSSLQSLRRGRPTEIPYLNGRIVSEAERHGLEAPVNAAVVGIMERIEGGRTSPSMDHLDDLPLG